MGIGSTRRGSSRSGTRWCKQYEGLDRFGPRELRNILRPVWFVLLDEVNLLGYALEGSVTALT